MSYCSFTIVERNVFINLEINEKQKLPLVKFNIAEQYRADNFSGATEIANCCSRLFFILRLSYVAWDFLKRNELWISKGWDRDICLSALLQGYFNRNFSVCWLPLSLISDILKNGFLLSFVAIVPIQYTSS